MGRKPTTKTDWTRTTYVLCKRGHVYGPVVMLPPDPDHSGMRDWSGQQSCKACGAEVKWLTDDGIQAAALLGGTAAVDMAVDAVMDRTELWDTLPSRVLWICPKLHVFPSTVTTRTEVTVPPQYGGQRKQVTLAWCQHERCKAEISGHAVRQIAHTATYTRWYYQIDLDDRTLRAAWNTGRKIEL